MSSEVHQMQTFWTYNLEGVDICVHGQMEQTKF